MNEDAATNENEDTPQQQTAGSEGARLVDVSTSDRGQQTGTMVRGRFALCLILAMVALADFTIYKALGYAGPAVFFAVAPILLCIGIPERSLRFCSLLLWILLGWLAYRLACNGNALQLVSGCWLLAALVYSFRRQIPFVLETLVFAAECFPGGNEFFKRINDRLRHQVLTPVEQGAPRPVVEILLPAIGLLLFGGVFVMANPDMVNLVSGTLGDFASLCWDFAVQFSPLEVVFWVLVAWLTGGCCGPLFDHWQMRQQAVTKTRGEVNKHLCTVPSETRCWR